MLDLNLDTLNAYLEGYNDRITDYQMLSVTSGYWSAYYSNSKHPKPVEHIIRKLCSRDSKVNRKHSNEVDVEAFLRTEERFKNRLRLIEERDSND